MLTLLITLLAIAAANPGDLQLDITGLTTETGAVMCTLYDSDENWLKDPGYVATVSVSPTNGGATCVFSAVPAGIYAISFMHDENGNGDMDSNFIGLPKEPWGMSRDAPARFGPPSFTAASFNHPSPEPLTAHAR